MRDVVRPYTAREALGDVMQESARHGLGWVPDLPDQRDLKLVIDPKIALNLPTVVDLRALMPPVVDQGQLGSCTGNAWAVAFDYERRREGRDFIYPSRLFIYYNERVLENSVDSDSGASIRDGVKTLVSEGVCPERDWPYDIARFKERPSADAYAKGLGAQVIQYMSVDQTQASLMGALASGYTVVFGFNVYQQFEDLARDQGGIVKMPSIFERPLGGHANCLVGYKDGGSTFISQNSWGVGWGDHGYCYFPVSYLTNRFLSADFWALKLIEPDEVVPVPPVPPTPPVPPQPIPTPPTPTPFVVGEGILRTMNNRGDVPATDESYYDGFSVAFGKSGTEYIYIESLDKVFVK